MSTELTLAQPGTLQFSTEQQDMIRATYASGAKPADFAVLIEIAKARGLNPLLGQVHFVERYNTAQKRSVWAVQVSIDGLRAIAQRTGFYAGQDEPEWADDESGKPIKCTVRVYRKDWDRPCVGVAYFAEYVQKTREGVPTKFWRDMPHVMIAKVAEALAIRKAFPEDTGGLYTNDEMDQADTPVQVQDQALKLITAPTPARKVITYNPAERPSWLSDEGEILLAFVESGGIEAIRAELKGQIAKCELGDEELAVLRGALDWRLSRG